MRENLLYDIRLKVLDLQRLGRELDRSTDTVSRLKDKIVYFCDAALPLAGQLHQSRPPDLSLFGIRPEPS